MIEPTIFILYLTTWCNNFRSLTIIGLIINFGKFKGWFEIYKTLGIKVIIYKPKDNFKVEAKVWGTKLHFKRITYSDYFDLFKWKATCNDLSRDKW